MTDTTFTNTSGTGLPMAVWLASEHYSREGCPFPEETPVWSATDLLKPLRRLVLEERLSPGQAAPVEVSSLAAAKTGTAVHRAIEETWKDKETRDRAMERLGYPRGFREDIRINPDPGDHSAVVPIHIERRGWKMLPNGTGITGQADFVIQGNLYDVKTTTVYAFTNRKQEKTDAWTFQGSIYRWLMPEIITGSFLTVNLLLTDWSVGRAEASSGKPGDYPPSRTASLKLRLFPPEDTERKLVSLTNSLLRARKQKQEDLIRCSREELWTTQDAYKFWAKRESREAGKRATKVFSLAEEAYSWQSSKGGGGEVVRFPGKPRACAWCPASPICTQREELGLTKEGREPHGKG